MRYASRSAIAAVLLLPSALVSQARPASSGAGTAEFMRAAEASGPADVAKNATIVRMEPNGKVTSIREGTNGFTCGSTPDGSTPDGSTPDGSNSRFCGADRQATGRMGPTMSKKPNLTDTQPGIACRAMGGVHFGTNDGAIVMEPGTGTGEVRQRPHWRLLWPVDSATSGLPTRPNADGSYMAAATLCAMCAGTPYPHLMVHQDPKMPRRQRPLAPAHGVHPSPFVAYPLHCIRRPAWGPGSLPGHRPSATPTFGS